VFHVVEPGSESPSQVESGKRVLPQQTVAAGQVVDIAGIRYVVLQCRQVQARRLVVAGCLVGSIRGSADGIQREVEEVSGGGVELIQRRLGESDERSQCQSGQRILLMF
jgi:hypothetical protein